MRTFEITSDKFGCKLMMWYSEEDTILGFKANRNLTEEEFMQLATICHYRLANLLRAYAKHPGLIQELILDITFEVMWEKYNNKLDKKRARDQWNKLKEKDKAEAYAYIPKYERELRQSGSKKMYLKTYLHQKIWQE